MNDWENQLPTLLSNPYMYGLPFFLDPKLNFLLAPVSLFESKDLETKLKETQMAILGFEVGVEKGGRDSIPRNSWIYTKALASKFPARKLTQWEAWSKVWPMQSRYVIRE